MLQAARGGSHLGVEGLEASASFACAQHGLPTRTPCKPYGQAPQTPPQVPSTGPDADSLWILAKPAVDELALPQGAGLHPVTGAATAVSAGLHVANMMPQPIPAQYSSCPPHLHPELYSGQPMLPQPATAAAAATAVAPGPMLAPGANSVPAGSPPHASAAADPMVLPPIPAGPHTPVPAPAPAPRPGSSPTAPDKVMVLAHLRGSVPCPDFSQPTCLQPGVQYWGKLPYSQALNEAKKHRTQTSHWRVESADAFDTSGATFMLQAYFSRDKSKLKEARGAVVW